jgi:hypothetical protein
MYRELFSLEIFHENEKFRDLLERESLISKITRTWYIRCPIHWSQRRTLQRPRTVASRRDPIARWIVPKQILDAISWFPRCSTYRRKISYHSNISHTLILSEPFRSIVLRLFDCLCKAKVGDLKDQYSVQPGHMHERTLQVGCVAWRVRLSAKRTTRT